MNDDESEVERLARDVRSWAKVAVYGAVGCGATVIIVVLLLTALIILAPACIFG